jgi:methyl-accepting chemotaxis protein
VETYLTYLTIFIGILTAALVAQAIVLFCVYRRLAKLAGELEKTMRRLSDQTAKIMAQVTELMNEVNQQASRYGRVGNEISSRVQHTINGVLDGVDRISTLATNGAAAVVRETSAAMNGILAAVSRLLHRPERKQLPPPDSDVSALH